MRTGTGPAGPNVISYSRVGPVGERSGQCQQRNPDLLALPDPGRPVRSGAGRSGAADLLAAGPEVDDFQYLLAVFADGSYDTLRTWR